ncbi:Potassium voltage-gated channel subfamily KQT; possible potassium channel, VIC family [hydrothermal vent metagenome]|uniref:Potassium voltage-gated channel subfamily KQT possible potassium channel, VIC family n=1 Tax=hydrothermal vent metagenome TaxID=652676 RepID=A0A3B1AMC8_9ZZZZ
MDLKTIVNRNDTSGGRIFDLVIFSLILLSIVTFSIETIPNLKPEMKAFLRVIEIVVVAIFTIEYFLRLYLADKKLGYIFSFYGLIDIIAIIPFYISSGIDLRTLRIFRLLRLFRLLKLIRYSKAIHRFSRAFAIAKEEIVLFVIATGMMLFLSAVGIYYFENDMQPEKFKSIFHSLWWAVTTLTTVGYGDMFPVTVGGKIFSFFILMIGLGIVAVPAGLMATALSKARMEEQSEE